MAHLMLQDPESEVSPVWPYWEDEEDVLERHAELDKRRQTLDPEAAAAKFAKAREAHYEKYPKRN